MKALFSIPLFSLFICISSIGFSQTKKDVLVMEYGAATTGLAMKTYGIYLYWPDREMEFIPIPLPMKTEEVINAKKQVYQKINELTDLGWELKFIDSNTMTVNYYFEKPE